MTPCTCDEIILDDTETRRNLDNSCSLLDVGNVMTSTISTCEGRVVGRGSRCGSRVTRSVTASMSWESEDVSWDITLGTVRR